MRFSLPQIEDCHNCGACCTGQAALPIHLAHPDETFRLPGVNPLPEYLRQELLALAAKFMRDGFPPDGSPCIWYDQDTKRCKHYQHRPVICRDEVKPGDEACRRWRRQTGIDPSARYRFVKGKLVKQLAHSL